MSKRDLDGLGLECCAVGCDIGWFELPSGFCNRSTHECELKDSGWLPSGGGGNCLLQYLSGGGLSERCLLLIMEEYKSDFVNHFAWIASLCQLTSVRIVVVRSTICLLYSRAKGERRSNDNAEPAVHKQAAVVREFSIRLVVRRRFPRSRITMSKAAPRLESRTLAARLSSSFAVRLVRPSRVV